MNIYYKMKKNMNIKFVFCVFLLSGALWLQIISLKRVLCPLSLVLLERFISLHRQLQIVYLAIQVEMDNFQPFSLSKWFYCCHPVAQTMDFLPFLQRVNTSTILRGCYYSLLYSIMKTCKQREIIKKLFRHYA